MLLRLNRVFKIKVQIRNNRFSMKNNIKNIELLAPAKNKETAVSAINAGADAVYVGYLKFGARSSAGNSIEDIKEIVDYAHIYDAKVYVTLNTIFKNEEIEQVVELINNLYEINVDGIIIQDMGLLEFDLPPIPIIASTQCHNNTVEKIQFLEKTGFKRVILPREFSIEEIKNISKNTNVELESFVHGALCVSYSGQCYLSQAIGGRSANRGECAQPCRKKYSLKDNNGNFIAKDKYLLSLKDFNLSKQLKDLILAGVTSFKIEGRLKDETYIKNIVSFYRQEIDDILDDLNLTKVSIGESIIEFEPNPYKTFNRGYTTYFLNERSKDISAINHSKSIGEFIGNVINTNPNFFTIENNILNVSDGICFFDEKQELIGSKINKIENGAIFPNSMTGIKKGTKIYRNYNHKFETILSNSNIARKIKVNIFISQNENDFLIKISDEKGISAEKIIKNTYEPANNADSARKTIKKQFSKLGDTEFVVNNINVDLKNAPFISISELNSLRRELIEKLQQKRKENYKKQQRKKPIETVNYPNPKLSFEANIYNDKAELFYKKRGVTEIELAAEKQKSMTGKRVMTTKHCLKYLFDLCPKQNKNQKFKEPLVLVDDYKKEYLLEFDCKNCEMHIKF